MGVKKDKLIRDGFGNSASQRCPVCGHKTVYVCRPGDFRCSYCEAHKNKAPKVGN